MTVYPCSISFALPKRTVMATTKVSLRPIRTQTDYNKKIQVINNLAMRKSLTKDQADCLELLSLLVESYEDKHYKIDTAHLTPLDALKHLLKENKMSASDLGRLLGHRELGSKILRGTRKLSKAHIQKLAKRFSVSAELFLGE